MKRIFTLIAISISFYGCVIDRIDVCQIKNNSPRTIQVKVTFDKQFLDSIFIDHNYRNITNSNGFAEDSGVTLINFDTLDLTLKYTVLPKSQCTLARGVWIPNEFNAITIISKDNYQAQRHTRNR